MCGRRCCVIVLFVDMDTLMSSRLRALWVCAGRSERIPFIALLYFTYSLCSVQFSKVAFRLLTLLRFSFWFAFPNSLSPIRTAYVLFSGSPFYHHSTQYFIDHRLIFTQKGRDCETRGTNSATFNSSLSSPTKRIQFSQSGDKATLFKLFVPRCFFPPSPRPPAEQKHRSQQRVVYTKGNRYFISF